MSRPACHCGVAGRWRRGRRVVVGGIVLAVVLSKRGKQGRRPLPDAAAAGPSPYACPRQPVPGMAYPNRPYSPQRRSRSRPVPQYQLRARLRCHRSTDGMSVRYLLGMLSLSSRRIRFRRIRFSRPNPILSLPPVRFPMSQAAMVRNRVIPHNSIRHNPMVGISPARAGMHGKP